MQTWISFGHRYIKTILLISFPFIVLCGCEGAVPKSVTVKTGAERTHEYLGLLKGKSVALVANNTSVIGKSHLLDSLLRLDIHITRVFAPEHGFRSEAGAGEAIGNGTDSITGIPVTSLYGAKTKPGKDDLKDVDIVVYDIQDVGVRFYTYISTLHFVMEACAENNLPLIILDRPDPLGFYVDGPVLDTAFRSFVGMHPVPVVYGMTAGEFARMINGEEWLANGMKCELTVIPCSGYDHASRYALPVNPSPNLNTMEAVYLYPSLCFFEGTVMSVGRGTTSPFRVIGHPDYPDTGFSFIPKASAASKNPLFNNKRCFGIDLRSLDVKELSNMDTLDLSWLIKVYINMGKNRHFFTGYFDRLAGTDALKKQILNGWTGEQIRNSWRNDLDQFNVIRSKYLLYPDFKH